jgi:signal transduction histidine kinase
VEKAQIRFATDVLRRLGEELTPSPDLGILELVKNAYDADATECTVELINTSKPGGTIRVVDNGDGMTAREIADGWLVLGKSRKSSAQITPLGRIPAGNKGLGRLAALRMGRFVTLISKPRNEDEQEEEYRLEIDWDTYEHVDLVDQVDLFIQSKQRPTESLPGSEIIMSGLLNGMNTNDVKRLARGLLLLADPFEDNPFGFYPQLKVPEFKALEDLVKKRYFDDAEYHLVAEVDQNGYVHVHALDWRGEVLFSGTHDDVTRSPSAPEERRKKHTPYGCPPAKFDLWVFLLDGKTFSSRSTTVGEVRDWLGEFGGVHLYQNRLRVSPYGNPGNDWLDMNLLRARNPEERPSTNTVIGRVSILDPSGVLIQKTDRAGFIETEMFAELRAFARDAIEWLALRRIEEREKRRTAERAEAPKQSAGSKKHLEEAIGSLPTEQQTPVKQAFQTYDRAREREAKQLKEDVQLYRTLSTAGITAATFAHESSGNPIKVIIQAIKALKRRIQNVLGVNYDNTISEPIERIERSIDSLSVLGSATLRLIDHEKRRVGRIELHAVVQEVLDVFHPFLQGREVSVETDLYVGNPYLRGSSAAIESIVTNLLNNSLTAFEASENPSRCIKVRTNLIDEKQFMLEVLDNGPGIEGINIKEIWLPGRTTRTNGTGLGLTIVRDTVIDLGGSVDAIPKGELGGAQIIIRLPIIGA